MPEILYEKRGRIAFVTINRPERRNALNRAAFGQLANAWLDFNDDPEIWVAIVTGAGENAFCSGGDLKEAIQFFVDNAAELASGEKTAGAEGYLPNSPLIAMLRDVEIYKPIIAAVNGICVAGGMEMLLGTDIRIASEKSSFGIFEPRRALFPGGGTTVRLPRQIPYCMAMEVLLTADAVPASLAYEMGIVNRVVPHEKLMETAVAFAETICKNGPVAVRMVKECVQKNLKLPLSEAFDLELDYSAKVFMTEDAQEGLAAFREEAARGLEGAMTTPRVYRDADADLGALAGRTVAVLGYGNQGRAQALNLRDSGVTVIVGNREDEYAPTARDDGFEPRSLADAAREADVALLLIPDEVQAEVYDREIAPHLGAGDVLCFAHGYNIAFDVLRPAKDIDVVMVAPRMIGAGVREHYVARAGFPSFIGVHQDASGQAQATMLAIAKGIGSTRAGCLEMSFADEAALDLFTEQAFGPAFGAALRAAMETLVEAGFPPEAVLLELYMSGELSTSLAKAAELGMVEQWNLHSHTSQYGSMTRGARFADIDLKERMTAILEEIRSGAFAKEWQAEQAAGLPIFKAVKEMVRQTPMVAWEEAARQTFGAPKKR